MKRIFGIFLESFPLEDNRRVLFLQNLLISFIVVVVLILFQPLGLANVTLPIIKLIPVYIGYGVLTFVTCTLADRVIKPAFPDFFDDQTWNVAKNIAWTVIVIMVIGLVNLFYSRMLGFTGLSGSSLVSFELYILSVSIIPVAVITLIRHFSLLSKNLKTVNTLNAMLSLPVAGLQTDTPLVFNSDDGKDSIRLIADQFLYAESADNYTDIVYVENGIIRRALIRSSLKRIEEMNTADFVVRVHRVFLVNIRKVKQVTGNAQGYRLLFDSLDESVPVSPRASQQVRDLFSQIHPAS